MRDDAKEQSLALWKQGKSLRQIEKVVGYSHETVRTYLTSQGIQVVRQRHINNPKPPRFCKHCGKQIEEGQVVRCKACATAYNRYRYPFLSSEQKRKHNEHTTRWGAEHAEKMKKSNQKATQRYREKKNLAPDS